MATYSRQERLAAIQKAGFSNPLTALAVSLAEFGENRDINAQSQSDYYSNGVREQSFGPWQINLPAHPDVTQACAMDLACSTAKAAQISNGGTDFGAWSAFTNGSYARFLNEITGGLGAIAAPSPSDGAVGPVGPTGPAGGTATTDCRAFNEGDIARASLMDMQGNPPQAIADALGVTLGCLKTRLGEAIGNISANPGVAAADKVGAAVSGATASVKSVGDFLGAITQPNNLWRAGFLVVAAVAIFAGARMYLASPAEEVSRAQNNLA